MALSRSRPDEIPKDAVIMTEEEAVIYQLKMISKWDKLSEVWALRFTPGIVAGLASCTGIFLNEHYRNKLKLGGYGRFSTYLPIVVIPALFSIMSHKYFVQQSILLRPMEDCATCIQMRAAACQIVVGVIYPAILAPLATCMFATRHYTIRLPSITENPFEVLQLLRKFTKPIVPTLGSIIVFQSLLTVYLTYKEQRQNINILIKLRQFEEQAEQKLRL